MDNSSVRFGPDRRLTSAAAVFAVCAVVAAVRTGDPAGRLLYCIGAVLLAGYAVVDVVCWPRLAACAAGLDLRTPFARVHLDWGEVDAVRADVRQRHGLRTTTLEVDAGARLYVFSRRALGADPERVVRLVHACRERA